MLLLSVVRRGSTLLVQVIDVRLPSAVRCGRYFFVTTLEAPCAACSMVSATTVACVM